MTGPPRWLIDEHLRVRLSGAIRSRNRSLGSEIIVACSVGDPSLADLPTGSSDPRILLWAEREGRILLTCDRHTMVAHFHAHLASGRHSPGLFLLPNRFVMSKVVDDLLLATEAGDPAEWRDQITFLPF